MKNLIDQIKNQQQKDGSFLDPAGLPSIIYTALIFSCLNNCQEIAEIKTIKEKAAGFLLSRKNEE